MWKFKQLIRCCPLCGWLWTEQNGLCRSCWSYLLNQRLKSFQQNRTMDGIQTRSLFDWGSHNDAGIRRLVLSLKGGAGDRALWRELSVALARSWIEAREGHGWVIVPSPPRKHGHEDHAVLLARMLGNLLGIEVRPALRRRDSRRRQKRLGRLARRAQSPHDQFEVIDRGNKYRRVLFVDDVVTTGATATGAWESLGRPKHFQVWSIARRLSCRP